MALGASPHGHLVEARAALRHAQDGVRHARAAEASQSCSHLWMHAIDALWNAARAYAHAKESTQPAMATEAVAARSEAADLIRKSTCPPGTYTFGTLRDAAWLGELGTMRRRAR